MGSSSVAAAIEAAVPRQGTAAGRAVVPVSLRSIPHPYRSMLAICSDLDETPDRRAYAEIMRFLNTIEPTSMGPGVGLEVGNTIYFDMPPGQFAYWNTDDAGREMIRTLIGSGHIDCLHSYGDLATSRAHAVRALDELDRHRCKLEVWVDHSRAPTNFGPDLMQGSGDVPGARPYHADLTLAYGIRYVWRGRTTGVNGQNVPVGWRTLAELLEWTHAIASARTLAKEATKVHLGRRGHPRWEMYGANRVCRPSRLRDGRLVWEFMRFNPFWGGSGRADTAEGFARVVNRRMLERFAGKGASGILYTHLGKSRDPHALFGARTRAALRQLAVAQEEGRVLVTTTHRLLRYLTVRDSLRYAAARVGDVTCIGIDRVEDPVSGPRRPTPDEVQGITFIVPRCDQVEVTLSDGRRLSCQVEHQGDTTVVKVAWRPLVFPEI